MAPQINKLKAVFLAALAKQDHERTAYLDEACADDAALRQNIETLLRAHDQSDPLLDRPAAEHLDTTAEPAEADDILNSLDPPTQPGSLGRIGNFEVLEVIGRGGFGIVFRAADDGLQRMVAIKVLSPHLAVTSPARKRFLREARLSAKMRHPNVVHVYGVGEKPLPYLTMELIPGESLQQLIQRAGPLEAAEVAQIGRQIADGLAAAHEQGMIHRDIKPGNILVESGPQRQVKITDFGLARAVDDASVTQSGVLAGTPMFMAPEQALGETLDHRADLFSLGSVLYTMCTGRPPFRASTTLAILKRVAEDTPRPIVDIIPETPQWLIDIISRLHAKNPADRFATAREVADLIGQRLDELNRAGNGSTDAATLPATSPATPPVPLTKIQKRPAIRRPGFRFGSSVAAAGILLMLAAGIGVAEATGITDVRGTVVRLFSPEGTLIVEVDDPMVSIRIDGSELVITGAGAREIRMKPGKYTVEARKDGEVVRRELVTVTRDGRQVVRVTQAPAVAEVVGEAKDVDRRAAEFVLSVGGTIRVNGEEVDRAAAADLPRESFRLTAFEVRPSKQINDASLAHFKDCKNLTSLSLVHMPLTDAGLAHLKSCKSLTRVWLPGLELTDAGLAHFKDFNNLAILNLAHTQKVSGAGLAHLKDCKNLTHLSLNETQVTDAGLAQLKECKNLTWLTLHLNPQVSDAALPHIAACKNLRYVELHETNVTAAAIAELKKSLPMCKIVWNGGVITPIDAAWERTVAAMPAAEQVQAVIARLKELNPGFDGRLPHKIVDGVVVEAMILSHIQDLSPVRALAGLKSLECNQLDGGRLLKDLTPLQDLPLTSLTVAFTPVSDLSPLKSMKLTSLTITCCDKVSDLSPLKDSKTLTSLNLFQTGVTDLSPLIDVKLKSLDIGRTGAVDLSPLKKMKLTYLSVRDMELSDLSSLQDMPIVKLQCQNSKVADLSPLHRLPLEELIFTPKTIAKGLEILRDMKSLKSIGPSDAQLLPAAEFWERYDKGEFK